MPRVTSAYAKNIIRRALRAVVDTEPSHNAVAELWHYFESRCAYCDRRLNRAGREGHIDHLVPTTAGGVNHLSNRVLACPPCNGDEKREEDWMTFLRKKVPDRATRTARLRKIEAWIAQNTMGENKPIDQSRLQREITRAVNAFERAVRNLRKQNAGGAQPKRAASKKSKTGKRTAILASVR